MLVPPRPRGRGKSSLEPCAFPFRLHPPSLVTQLSNYPIDLVAWLLWTLDALLFRLPGAWVGTRMNRLASGVFSDEFYRVCMPVTLAQYLPTHSSLPLTHTSLHYYGTEQ